MVMHGLKMAAVAGAAVCVAASASAQEKLILTSMSPPNSANSKFFAAWATKITRESGGTIDIDMRDGNALGNYGNVYDRVVNNVVQIGWSIHQVVAGKFPLTDVGGLPYLTPDGATGAVALWRVYKAGLLESEYKDVVPLFLAPFPAGNIHYTKAPRGIDDLRGLKVSSSGRTQAQLIGSLGGAAISLQPQDLYEGLNRNTVDAAIISWAGFAPYKLQEVTFFHLEGALGQNTSMFFMSRQRLAALPERGRKAIEDNVNEAQTRAFGAYFEDQANQSRAPVASSDKHKVVRLTAEQSASWEKKFAPVLAEWAKERAGGEAVLAAYRKEIAAIKN
jgi:TRAP-type C4-dicarboxylate transport system substrate-binding protein